MKTQIRTGSIYQTKILILSKSEKTILKQAQAIAEKIRECLDSNDYDNPLNINAANIEHGATDILESKELILESRVINHYFSTNHPAI